MRMQNFKLSSLLARRLITSTAGQRAPALGQIGKQHFDHQLYRTNLFNILRSASHILSTRLYTAPLTSFKTEDESDHTKRLKSTVSFGNTFVDSNEPEEHTYNYDLIVIGGGSGGLACAKEAAGFEKKVALLDFVKPSPLGTQWGLGGTCVNVGCIPKKLMHCAANLGEAVEDAKAYGWEASKTGHKWELMVEKIQEYISSLNWGYRTDLRSKKVEYLNAYGVFVDPHTVETTNRAGKKSTITARRFVIATGGRPRYPNIPGAKEFGITSDDLFSLEKAPGKTLVVGASYVALECAGFLTGLGYDTTVMARSIFLRGFDQQVAEAIGKYMQKHGTKIIRPAVPTSVEKLESGKLKVRWNHDTEGESSDEFDTVLFAVGRDAETKAIGLDKAGVETDPETGKIPAINERTNVPHIYAIGDILKDRLELTPVAIKAGRLLARRLYNGETTTMDYTNVPTTIFTPIEYGCCGLPEEAAIKLYGEDNIEVYHTYYRPLEWTVASRPDNACYAKIITNKNDNERVIGFHVLGIHAGEITQGFGAAIKAGITKAILDETVGIHPTSAEEFTTLSITKRSGISPEKHGC